MKWIAGYSATVLVRDKAKAMDAVEGRGRPRVETDAVETNPAQGRAATASAPSADIKFRMRRAIPARIWLVQSAERK